LFAMRKAGSHQPAIPSRDKSPSLQNAVR